MAAGRTVPGAPRTPGDRSLVELVILPGAHHSFDVLELSLAPTRGVSSHGYRVEYNEAATQAAIARVRGFLQRTIDGQSANRRRFQWRGGAAQQRRRGQKLPVTGRGGYCAVIARL